MATLTDVAKIAGVGVMSVSRVVNGTRRVTPATERKVRAAIERVGYEPNEAARVLKGHRARVLGLIVPDLADPFIATCANAIQETAREAGYMTMMAASAHRIDVERQQTEIMVQRQVAGLFVMPIGTQTNHFIAARNSGILIVSLDRPLDHVEADTLMVDNRIATARATKHLIDHGHRHILCIADDETHFTKMERVAGYSQAMRQAKLPTQVCLCGPISGSLPEQLDSALKSTYTPTAILALSNVLAVKALHELQDRSVRIPQTMAFISFDDFDAATLVRPTITVVQQPVSELGRQAAHLLLTRLSEEAVTGPSRIVLPTELIIRQSCGCGMRKKRT